MTYSFAFITDFNYLKITMSAIKSLIMTKSINAKYKIFLILVGKFEFQIPNELKNSLVEFDLLWFDENMIKGLKGINHVSSATYVKFFLPEMINEDTLLFLDGDIYIEKNIEILWSYLSSDDYLGAVWDPGYYNDDYLLKDVNNKNRFNAGVLLLNCKKMRDNHISNKLLEFALNNSEKLENADQTVFNYVFNDKWKRLPLEYNVQRAFFTLKKSYLCLFKKERNLLINNPALIHFTTHSKPWMLRCAHPYKKYFLKVYKSLFGKLKYHDCSIMSLVKRTYESLQYFISKWLY